MSPSELPRKPQRHKVWLKQSTFDLQAAWLSFDNNFYEWACYQSEQAVEKALKAVIVHAGQRAPKMHKLTILIGMCNSTNEQFRKTKFEFRDLESFTFISRYPFLIPGENLSPHEFIRKEDAQKCLSQAEAFLQKIKGLLKE